ncbi:hypothetical protein [Nodularia spumigena]|jgi:hypothetical protein|uniref:Uncharacterized protein n=1 Tax=Nodularia spumigena UHCC 0060 TaxID=3110300 RepID=A0ABU5UVG6_NODSP|nr:hypothetical protein [Nodularia spumigena]MBO1052993.1 hypothetical protein [Dolichospermum sp. DET73]MBS9396080.1 hypothetical protein [Dolichospermum sp. OL01]MCO5799769.1 hypothetical protein [Dolichospermum sp. OL03]MDK2410764.1 hypothetical protein [Aphanizomenon sp. 202]MDK2461400.1 hypothetical protein [Aphanizomenon sp. PH219]
MTHQVDSENNLSGASIFSKLEQCVKDGRKGECSLSPEEKAILFQVRQNLERGYTYETPFIWKHLVVNTNWLSLCFPRTIVVTLEYYKTLPPTVNY